MNGLSESTLRILAVLRSIPPGRVISYGEAARLAGLSRGARQVARILHSSSESRGLPWHRVVRKDGGIALPRGSGFELQKTLLESEGLAVSKTGRVDIARFGWNGKA